MVLKTFRTIFFLGILLVAGMMLSGFSSYSFLPFRWVTAATTAQQTITVTVTSTITLSLGSATINLETLTPGTPVQGTASATVLTNSDTGWAMYVKRDTAAQTLSYGSTSTFPDAAEWYVAGSANASVTPGQNLSFRVTSVTTTAALYNSAWWGATDASGTAKFAGFPSSSKIIATRSDYSASQQAVAWAIQADAPTTQRSGVYTGTVTFTTLVLP